MSNYNQSNENFNKIKILNKTINNNENLNYKNYESDKIAECTAKQMDKCRLAIIGIRGSYLEMPCYCDSADQDCIEKQNLILPNNPCIGYFFLILKYF